MQTGLEPKLVAAASAFPAVSENRGYSCVSWRSAFSKERQPWFISPFYVDSVSSAGGFCSGLTFVFGDVFLPCVREWRRVCVSVCMSGGRAENKSPAVALISSSFVSALRRSVVSAQLPLQLHLLPTVITQFNASGSQTVACRSENKPKCDKIWTQDNIEDGNRSLFWGALKKVYLS